MAEGQRQFIKYTFYKVQPEWRRLPRAQRVEGAQEFCATATAARDETLVLTYNLQGMRGDVDFLVRQIAPALEPVQDLAARLANTGLGRYTETPYSYLAMTRRSSYVDTHRHAGQESSTPVSERQSKYYVVYPFWKTRPWYRLTQEERQEMMSAHIKIGHKYPSVRINTSYSFGLDDPEFVVGFDTDEPADFLDLVMELRETEGSLYTLRDTPIFTCVSMELDELLDGLVGTHA